MTVREMHIEVEQSIQQVAANRGRSFLPEEIDWILNKIQDRFILSCLRPRQDGSGGFELDQAKADHIRMLVTSTRTPLRAYEDGNERYKVHLPPDYGHLLADWSYSKDLCGGVATLATETQFITSLSQSRSTLATPPYYMSVLLAMPNATVNIPADLAPVAPYAGYREKEDISFLVPWILWKGKILYWEKFDDLYLPGKYITVLTSAFAGSVMITVDAVPDTNEVVNTRVKTYHTSGIVNRHDNRLTAQEKIPSLNSSRYWKTAHYSPLSELEGMNLIIHRDNSFIVTGVGISYIRKPQPISLGLNSDCELSGEGTHQAICDLAVEYIKGTVQNSEGRSVKTQDIAERVTI